MCYDNEYGTMESKIRGEHQKRALSYIHGEQMREAHKCIKHEILFLSSILVVFSFLLFFKKLADRKTHRKRRIKKTHIHLRTHKQKRKKVKERRKVLQNPVLQYFSKTHKKDIEGLT